MKKIHEVEIHVKGYGRNKISKKLVGLETRLLIHTPKGNTEIHNFDYNFEARKFLLEKFGELKEGNYKVISNWSKYGKAGYRW